MNDQNFKIIEEDDFPKKLHQRMIRKIFFLKTRTHFILAEIILFFGLIASGWHLWVRLQELQTIPIMDALFDGFAWSSDFFSGFVDNFYQFVPIASILVFLINILAIVYLGYIYFQFRKLKTID